MGLLVQVETIKTDVVFAGDGPIQQMLAEARAAAEAMVGDATVDTAAGREAIKSAAYQVARTKTAVDDLGKDLVADVKKQVAAIDARRKVWRDEMDRLRDAVRKPLTDYETAEYRRLDEIARAEAARVRAAQEAALAAERDARHKAEQEAQAMREELARLKAQEAAQQEEQRVRRLAEAQHMPPLTPAEQTAHEMAHVAETQRAAVTSAEQIVWDIVQAMGNPRPWVLAEPVDGSHPPVAMPVGTPWTAEPAPAWDRPTLTDEELQLLFEAVPLVQAHLGARVAGLLVMAVQELRWRRAL